MGMIKVCPRCGRRYDNEYPAISRVDNKTKICPRCGSEEAIIDFFRHNKERKR